MVRYGFPYLLTYHWLRKVQSCQIFQVRLLTICVYMPKCLQNTNACDVVCISIIDFSIFALFYHFVVFAFL
jgi:hypothetical protein